MTKGVEDVAQTTLTFPSGVFATIHNSWLDPVKVRDMTIVGEKKMIVYDDMEVWQKVKIFDERVDMSNPDSAHHSQECRCHCGDVHVPYFKQEEPLRVECKHFVDCIKSGDQPMTCGRRGMELVKILEASSLSLKNSGDQVLIKN